MSGAHVLIVAIIIAFVIAFIITMVVLNANAKKIIAANTKLVENQNTLLEQNKQQGNELEEQKEIIEMLQRQQEEMAEKLKNNPIDQVALLREKTREHREHIELTSDMTDEELMAWIDQKMDETSLFLDSSLTLKIMANSLGLTQRRLSTLFKNKVHPTNA